jgi:hypothetical protein
MNMMSTMEIIMITSSPFAGVMNDERHYNLFRVPPFVAIGNGNCFQVLHLQIQNRTQLSGQRTQSIMCVGGTHVLVVPKGRSSARQ